MEELYLKISYSLGEYVAKFGNNKSLDLVRLLEKTHFDGAWMGDHFHTWWHTDAHALQAWIWIAAAEERTERIPIGTGVTAPMFRYHPLIVAQAFASLATLYPGRVILGVGTGEAHNEIPFVGSWPAWRVRAEMLVDAIDLIRKYWTSNDYFDYDSKYFKVRKAYCLDKPKKAIPICFAAGGKRSAEIAGKHADHLIAGASLERCRDVIFPAFERGARSVGKNIRQMEKAVYLDVGYGNVGKLVQEFRRTGAGSLLSDNFDEPDPRKIELSTRDIPDEMIRRNVHFYSRAEEFVEVIDRYGRIGADHVILGDWGYAHEETIRIFGERVIPHFKE